MDTTLACLGGMGTVMLVFELADPTHNVIAAQTVAFTIPDFTTRRDHDEADH
jgi:hypothetical protein